MPNTTVLTSGENKSKYTDNLNFKYQGHGKNKIYLPATKICKTTDSLYKSMSRWPTAKSLDFLPNLLTFQTPEDFGSSDSDVGWEKKILKNLYIPSPHCAQGCIFLLVVLGLSWI